MTSSGLGDSGAGAGAGGYYLTYYYVLFFDVIMVMKFKLSLL